MQYATAEEWFVESSGCESCPHPAWAHGPGGICSECDAGPRSGGCGLLSLYGFDLAALPLDERAGAAAPVA